MESLNVYQRMLKVEEELGVVAKNLTIPTTKEKGYKAVSERDVLDAVKPLEAKYGIYSYPFSREIIENETLESEKTYDGRVYKVTSKFIRIETVYRFVNIDNGQFVEIKSYGDGIDTGDKAVGKAMTYADKYALMKAYKISTGDDPDQEKSPDEGYDVKTKSEPKATTKQIAWIRKNIDPKEYDGIKLDDLTMKQASDLIQRWR